MGRPKGSKNRQAGAAKAAKSAPRSDGVTTTKHNIAAAAASLTDDERQALTRHHVGQYKRDLEAKKAADATFKNTCKKAKSDGVALSEIKTFIEMETPEGEKRVAENLEQSLRIARWLGATSSASLPMAKRTATLRARPIGPASGRRWRTRRAFRQAITIVTNGCGATRTRKRP